MKPFDHLVIIYSWFIFVITINQARPIENYMGVLAFHFSSIAFVLLLVYIGEKSNSRLITFFRLLYPVMLMAFYYETSGKLVHLIIPEFLDFQVVAFEKLVFGISPTIWLDNHLGVFWTELFSASYFSYYLLIPGLSLIFFFHRKDEEIIRFMTALCATFFVSYMIFILYPIEGPRYYLATQYQNSITSPIFRPMVDFVIKNGAFHGGAMPSSHCAVALIVMLFAIKNYSRKAWLLIPVIMGLSVGTVYGRFHYISDVVVGLLIGIICYGLVSIYYPIKTKTDNDYIS
ncbi:MAG: phosphatase PAP2 family protein [Candidatus Zixiibacteriota bacterium]